MELRHWLGQSLPLAGAPGAWRISASLDNWHHIAADLAAGGARPLALWIDTEPQTVVYAAFLCEGALLCVDLPLAATETSYPSLTENYPCAARMQRAATDLTGVRARDTDARPWLRHDAWPADYFPLRAPDASSTTVSLAADDPDFVRVSGDGVDEIPVGPIRAGIIESGHFLFSIVGEKVLKLEARLGYFHKGVEQRFAQLPLLTGHQLAARVSGDSAVAYAWAYCQALEGMAGCMLPERALWLRALALESERIANHLADLGALGNDAGFAFGLAQFSRLKERWLRALQSVLGQRYLLDFITPGGVRVDAVAEPLARLCECALHISTEAAEIRAIYDEHSGIRDRFAGAGTVQSGLASQLGLTGLAGRASGQAYDLRIDLPCAPYTQLRVRKCGHTTGDVAARVTVRFEELFESLRLVTHLASRLPSGAICTEVSPPAVGTHGIGVLEGWRGPVMIALSAAEDGRIARCHAHDPSWQNRSVLEHAIIGNVVPDFPLIDKSFSWSYSRHGL